MIKRYSIGDILHKSHLGNEEYCKSSDVEQLENDRAEEIMIAISLERNKAKDKIEQLEKDNAELLEALKTEYRIAAASSVNIFIRDRLKLILEKHYNKSIGDILK
jgi:hypothetical protein